MKQNENEIKGKELFELSLTFTEGDEEKQFSVTMKAKKDGKETSLDLFDSDFLEMSYTTNGRKITQLLERIKVQDGFLYLHLLWGY